MLKRIDWDLFFVIGIMSSPIIVLVLIVSSSSNHIKQELIDETCYEVNHIPSGKAVVADYAYSDDDGVRFLNRDGSNGFIVDASFRKVPCGGQKVKNDDE